MRFLASVFLVLSTGLVGCNEMKGIMDVHQKITLKEGSKNKSVAPGSYDVELKIKNKKRVDLTIKANKDIKLKLAVNTDDIKDGNGEFFLPAKNSNQIYDISGMREQTQTSKYVAHEMESCQYEERRIVCYSNHYGQQHCYYETYYRNGWRDVSYDLITTLDEIQFAMTLPANGQSVADGQVSDVSREKRYRYQGICGF